MTQLYGIVDDVDRDRGLFTARFWDDADDDRQAEQADFLLDALRSQDEAKIQIGDGFSWQIDADAGTSIIRLFDATWTQEEIDAAKRDAAQLLLMFK